MARRFFHGRPGLLVQLCILAGFLLNLPLGAQSGSPGIFLETSSAEARSGENWYISILVDHPNPMDVAVKPPVFPPGLSLERVRTGTRFISTPSGPEEGGLSRGGRRWTELEFLFVPQEEGLYRVPPFEISLPTGFFQTAAFTVQVGGGNQTTGASQPKAVWENAPASLVPGQVAEIRLRLTGVEAKDAAAQDTIAYRPVALAGILEALPENGSPDAVPAGSGAVLRFRLIPLDGPEVLIPAGLLRYGEQSIPVPALRIEVGEGPGIVPGADAPVSGTGGVNTVSDTTEPALELLFPAEIPQTAFFLFRPGMDRLVAEARRLWSQGLYAQALTVLRKGERDLAAGPALRSLREAVERALGLEPGQVEPGRPRVLFLVLGIMAGCATMGLLILIVTRGRRRGLTIIMILLGIIAVAGFTGFAARSAVGVMQETSAYRAPDNEAAPTVQFREGELVRLITRGGGSWIYVESQDGATGWVPADRIIMY
ncbi:MAG: hypothetical protein LBT11_02130 [Treponema sp.]|nr:hypothetical protein [Treponema sp.]